MAGALTSISFGRSLKLVDKAFHLREMLGDSLLEEMQQGGIVDRLGVDELKRVLS
jgi:hypothetical protein